MANSIGKSPFAWIDLDETGKLSKPTAMQSLNDLLVQASAQDLVIIAHGWKNSHADASKLYESLWSRAQAYLKAREPDKVVVAGVLWPAKQYDDDFDVHALQTGASKTLSAAAGSGTRDLTNEEFDRILAGFLGVFGEAGAPTAAAAKAVAKGINGTTAGQLLQHSKNLMTGGDLEFQQDTKHLHVNSDPSLLLTSLAMPPMRKVSPNTAGTMGLGEAVSSLIQGPRAAAARFLNNLTYFEMKKRAGICGHELGATHLPTLKPAAPLRLHLIGHSFGARFATAVADAIPSIPDVDFRSIILLQGAFSHNALRNAASGLAGAFPAVVGKPTGAFAVTHTHNDLACTLAYAFASRLSGDTTQSIGDAADPFGAMGANGPQGVPAAAVVAGETAAPFRPVPNRINSFLADGYIVKTDTLDAHGNVTNPTVAELVAAVVDL